MIIPPAGILIYLTAAQAEAQVTRVVRELVPFTIALLLLLALIIFYPPLVTWLPSAVGK